MRFVPIASILVLALMPRSGWCDPPAVDALIKQLGSPSFRIRASAYQKLLKRRDAEPALRRALSSTDNEIAQQAARVLKEYSRRPLYRARKFAKAGRIDLYVELVSKWPKGQFEMESWREATKIFSAIRRRCPKYGERMEKILKLCQRVTTNSSADFVHTDNPDRDTNYHVRAKGLKPTGAFMSTPLVTTWGFTYTTWLPCFVLSNGTVHVVGNVDYVVCDSDVVISGDLRYSFIIARGKVVCKGPVSNCHIISTKSVQYIKRATRNCTIIENATKPLGFIRFFETADVGIVVADAKVGVRVKMAASPRRFAKAGVRVGDVITHVDGNLVKDPEQFRRLIRVGVAKDETIFVDVLRAGQKQRLSVAPPPLE